MYAQAFHSLLSPRPTGKEATKCKGKKMLSSDWSSKTTKAFPQWRQESLFCQKLTGDVGPVIDARPISFPFQRLMNSCRKEMNVVLTRAWPRAPLSDPRNVRNDLLRLFVARSFHASSSITERFYYFLTRSLAVISVTALAPIDPPSKVFLFWPSFRGSLATGNGQLGIRSADCRPLFFMPAFLHTRTSKGKRIRERVFMHFF